MVEFQATLLWQILELDQSMVLTMVWLLSAYWTLDKMSLLWISAFICINTCFAQQGFFKKDLIAYINTIKTIDNILYQWRAVTTFCIILISKIILCSVYWLIYPLQLIFTLILQLNVINLINLFVINLVDSWGNYE